MGWLGSSGYNTKCLYEALCLLETVRDGALLLREERRFVFIGCLECVGGLWTSALLAYVNPPPTMNLLVV